MKKLLLVVLVVTLASFLFVGCLPTTPPPDDEDGDDSEVGICPTVAVTSQVAVGGKNYIKAGSQTITVTFAVPTEPVSVYVGAALKDNPVGVPTTADEVVLYTADGGLTYTGTVLFAGDCDEAYIYVLTCDTCAPCKYPYTVDGVGPYANIEVKNAACTCEGCAVTFDSAWTTTGTCADTTGCCGDACTELTSWSMVLYSEEPFDECCSADCDTPFASDSGTCPVSFTTPCLVDSIGTDLGTVWVVVSLADSVGNETKYFATLTGMNPDTCSVVTVTEYASITVGGVVCTDWSTVTDTGDDNIGFACP